MQWPRILRNVRTSHSPTSGQARHDRGLSCGEEPNGRNGTSGSYRFAGFNGILTARDPQAPALGQLRFLDSPLTQAPTPV